MVNEYLRRMKNCSRDMAQNTLERFLQGYSAELKRLQGGLLGETHRIYHYRALEQSIALRTQDEKKPW